MIIINKSSGVKVEGFTPSRKGREGICYRRKTIEDSVELIEGRIIDRTPIGGKHAACVSRLNEIFSEKLQKRAIINIQNPICLTEYSGLEPDIAIIKRRPDFYAEKLP